MLFIFLAGEDVVPAPACREARRTMRDILSLIRVSMTPRFFMSVSRWPDKFATQAGALANGSRLP